MKKPKLTIELVPKTCFYSNVRSVLPKKIWDKLRKQSYKKAKHKCQVCGDVGTNQGYRHAVECHEIWEYRDNTQILKGLVSLCPKCHQAKHIGRTIAIGKGKEIFEHIAKVNKWSLEDVERYVGACFQEHKERSKIQWVLNLRVLTETYGVDKKLIKEDMRTKTSLKAPWKSKWRSKKKKKRKLTKRPSKRR